MEIDLSVAKYDNKVGAKLFHVQQGEVFAKMAKGVEFDIMVTSSEGTKAFFFNGKTEDALDSHHPTLFLSPDQAGRYYCEVHEVYNRESIRRSIDAIVSKGDQARIILNEVDEDEFEDDGETLSYIFLNYVIGKDEVIVEDGRRQLKRLTIPYLIECEATVEEVPTFSPPSKSKRKY